MTERIVINVNPKARYTRPGMLDRRDKVLSQPTAVLSRRVPSISRNKAVLAKSKLSRYQRVNTKAISAARKVWSKKRKHVAYRSEEINYELTEKKKKTFTSKLPKQIMGLNATFSGGDAPATQFPANPYESYPNVGGFFQGPEGDPPVGSNEKEKNYMLKKQPKKTFKSFVNGLKEMGFVGVPGSDGSPTQDDPSMGTVPASMFIQSSKENKKRKRSVYGEARMTGRNKFAKLMAPHADALGDIASKLKKNADDYAAVVKKYPAKTTTEQHIKCGTNDCCGECD